MPGPPIHLIFDLLAAAASMGVTLSVWRWRLGAEGRRLDGFGAGYGLALIAGAALGGYGAGTAKLWLMGAGGVGRSILGALGGAVLAIELYKARRGIRGSTGLIFVPAFATSVAVGRIGCFLAGLPDMTWGVPTALPWGHDFGDGIPRHPVQIYESLTMAAFLIVALVLIGRRSPRFHAEGFYWMVAVYAAQRLLWEGLKPYPALVGPLSLFQLLCLALLAYAFTMILTARRPAPE